MKSKEELNALKEEVETLNKKLAELSEDELSEVTGGVTYTENSYGYAGGGSGGLGGKSAAPIGSGGGGGAGGAGGGSGAAMSNDRTKS